MLFRSCPTLPNRANAADASGWVRVGSTAGAIAWRGAATRTAHQAAVAPPATTASAVTMADAVRWLADKRKRLTVKCQGWMPAVRQVESDNT